MHSIFAKRRVITFGVFRHQVLQSQIHQAIRYLAKDQGKQVPGRIRAGSLAKAEFLNNWVLRSFE